MHGTHICHVTRPAAVCVVVSFLVVVDMQSSIDRLICRFLRDFGVDPDKFPRQLRCPRTRNTAFRSDPEVLKIFARSRDSFSRGFGAVAVN
jgi:hypothetical protein